MRTGEQLTDFLSYYEGHLDVYRADKRRLSGVLERSNVKYGAWTLMCEMMPLILARDERAAIARAAEHVLAAAERFTQFILDHSGYHRHFHWPPAFWDVVRLDPGYSLNVPCARCDSFLDGAKLTFIELNTDGCSGMSNADAFHEGYASVVQPRAELGLAGCTHDAVVPHVIDTLLACYREFRDNNRAHTLPAEPVIGILDWKGEETRWEFDAIASACRARGLAAHVVSPDEAAFDGTGLSFDGTRIHLIYRRLLGADYAAGMDKLDAVTAAYRARAVCMVGSPRSQIAFSKKFFAFLHDPVFLESLPDETRAVVRQTVPWTRVLEETKADFHGETADLVPFVLAHRERFVLKPAVSKCGIGIMLGRSTPEAEWNCAVLDAVAKDFIIQELVPSVEANFSRFTKRQPMERRFIHLGEYVFGGRFSGFLGRTCAHELLNIRHGERLLPVLTAGQ
ncbi:hypothetical protein GX586_01895 [bacterium]|nr:hypothetical protein [bacterium]